MLTLVASKLLVITKSFHDDMPICKHHFKPPLHSSLINLPCCWKSVL